MAKIIMVQGTMSNAGKSFVVAGLCRIFKQDGYRVAPFKSQNMALNSFITRDGGEMGRAQVMQAEACGIEPEVRMNPILLKPTTDMGSQVIVNGKVWGNYSARDYYTKKDELIPEIQKALDGLKEDYDIIVIEGAGSAAELNLRGSDIVNMGMAKIANSPVLLVGDIDRGGVFAQLIGTVSLLEPDERKLVAGLIVNKFRGDKTLFDEGVRILEEKSGVPVAGVIPYINVDIEDEDSLSSKLDNKASGLIDIAVIRLPKISNFTDFDCFLQYPDVSVRFIDKTSELKSPDMIVIPGTKSTIADMEWLRSTGFEAAIKKYASKGGIVFGICGGFQMLGNEICDPDNTEGGGSIRGMELLNTTTVFEGKKHQTQTEGHFADVDGALVGLSKKAFRGYEIHMGRTDMRDDSLTLTGDGVICGCQRGNTYGTYVHGIFDEDEISLEVVKTLFDRKGLEFTGKAIDRAAYKESQYDKLADNLRENLNMELIYSLIS